jgi:hypothetical protein
VTGKPSPFLLTDIIAKHNCVPAKMIMVGDRLDTDILWGRNTGMATLLVMTGGANKQGPEPPDGCIATRPLSSRNRQRLLCHRASLVSLPSLRPPSRARSSRLSRVEINSSEACRRACVATAQLFLKPAAGTL